MISQSEEKIPEGKLLRVKVELSDKTEILKVQITGDFFIHPEEKLKLIEEMLSSIDSKSSEEQLNDMISRIILNNQIQLIGIDSEAIARNARKAIDKAQK